MSRVYTLQRTGSFGRYWLRERSLPLDRVEARMTLRVRPLVLQVGVFPSMPALFTAEDAPTEDDVVEVVSLVTLLERSFVEKVISWRSESVPLWTSGYDYRLEWNAKSGPRWSPVPNARRRAELYKELA